MTTMIVGTLAILISVGVSWYKAKESSQQNWELKLDSYQGVISSLLRMVDYSSVVEVSRVIASDPGVLQVNVKNRFHSTIASIDQSIKKSITANSPSQNSSLILTRSMYYKGDPNQLVGTIELVVSEPNFSLIDLQETLVLCGLMALGCALLGYWVFKSLDQSIVRPIQKIHGLISDFDGYKWRQLDVSGPEEVEALGKALNSMAGDLVERASTDALTGLMNRSSILDQLRNSIKQAQCADNIVNVYYFDLDNFKRINDHFGHEAGDQLLRLVGNRLQQLASNKIFVARLGGDEFLVVEVMQDNEKSNMVNEIMAIFDNDFRLDHRKVIVNCSMGVASYPNNGYDVANLVRKADLALYSAKAGGRDQCAVYHKSLGELNARWIEASDTLRYALANNQIHHAFQPIVSVVDEGVWAAEALLRVKTNYDKPVSPADILMVAKEQGLLNQLGIQTMNNAVSWLKHQKEIGNDDVLVSVNFSKNQLLELDIKDYFIKHFQPLGVSQTNIIIEITEEGLLEDLSVQECLQELSSFGFLIALDDLGSGFSSFACLSDLPIDIVKLDKSLVKRLSSEQSLQVIFSGIISIAKELNIRVIAEGIETFEDLVTVRKLGCHLAQGYYLGMPKKFDAVDCLNNRDQAVSNIYKNDDSLKFYDEAVSSKSLKLANI
jgi:diguanylate cyclase (GGDEF)-like protein